MWVKETAKKENKQDNRVTNKSVAIQYKLLQYLNKTNFFSSIERYNSMPGNKVLFKEVRGVYMFCNKNDIKIVSGVINKLNIKFILKKIYNKPFYIIKDKESIKKIINYSEKVTKIIRIDRSVIQNLKINNYKERDFRVVIGNCLLDYQFRKESIIDLKSYRINQYQREHKTIKTKDINKITLQNNSSMPPSWGIGELHGTPLIYGTPLMSSPLYSTPSY